ncbi:cupredoxin domain-containing protein [Bacillus sp. NTK034]|uniref:cupredoxin domain-containing protein n=1 Tax=Bacillus sp. NTK034 TaxID=2802176 RepID=UPI001FD264C0|nr:cupredoxin domain-containing protein [Bacillus sp. NTK034]
MMNQETNHGTHGHESHIQEVPSNIVEEIQTEWNVSPATIKPKQETEISLSVKNNGKNIISFSTVHEKQMHILVISHDLSIFQHLHPNYDGEGKFSVKIIFPKSGKYKIFADFLPEGSAQQLAKYDLIVEGEEQYETVNSDKELKKQVDNLMFELKFDDLAVKQHVLMTFTVTDSKGNKITDLEPYLGSAGHVVIVSEKMDEFLHVHPKDEAAKGPDVEYMTTFPISGKYKIWGQFKYLGKLYTVPFVINVPGK